MICLVPEPPTYAELLKNLREHLRLSQRAMGEFLGGYGRETYKNWEYGDSDPPPDVVEKLEQIAGKEGELLREHRASYIKNPLSAVNITGIPTARIRFVGNVPSTDPWKGLQGATGEVELDAKFAHPDRFSMRAVGLTSWPLVEQADQLVFHLDRDPPVNTIVLLAGESGCAVAQLVHDESIGLAVKGLSSGTVSAPVLDMPVVARLVGLVRKSGRPEKTFYWAEGIVPEDLA